MPGDGERDRLGQTFNQVAESYDRIRPEYPETLFADLVALTGLKPGDQLLEVGCATGQATLPLARRGFRITCIELGPELAAVARRNLAGFPVEVIEGRFEEWRPREPVSCVFAATAWHWIDPAVRYGQAWRALRPGGHLVIWAQGHVFPDGGDPFFRELQDVYDEIGEGLPADTVWPRPGELPDERAGIEASGLFEVVAVRQYDWEVVYTAEEYIELLGTFSGHLTMADWQRDRLFGEIRRRLAQRRDRPVRRAWGAVLHVARRREPRLRGPLDLAEELRVGGGLAVLSRKSSSACSRRGVILILPHAYPFGRDSKRKADRCPGGRRGGVCCELRCPATVGQVSPRRGQTSSRARSPSGSGWTAPR